MQTGMVTVVPDSDLREKINELKEPYSTHSRTCYHDSIIDSLSDT